MQSHQTQYNEEVQKINGKIQQALVNFTDVGKTSSELQSRVDELKEQ